MTAQKSSFIPALRFGCLTPLYDVVVRYTTRERPFKSLLVDAASIRDNEAVLDVGCGTGTLLAEVARRIPSAQLTGFDADPAILQLAEKKLARAGVPVELVLGTALDLPFNDCQFDHVVSSLFFHHLVPEDKQSALNEIARVLRPGGTFHLADWGPATGVIQRLAFYQIQLLDGFSTTREHTTDRFLKRIVDAGLETVEIASVRTMFGTLRILGGQK